jgi:hypothetical protein
VTLIWSACLPAFAQKARSIPKAVNGAMSDSDASVRSSIADYERIEAFSDGRGVFIRWQMKAELNNIGFLVYRTSRLGTELASRGMVPSAMRATTAYGEVYETYDPSGNLHSSYVIQNQFRSGNRVSTGAFSPMYTADFQAATGYSKDELESRLHSQNGNLRRDALQLPSDLQTIVTGSVQPPNPAVQREIVTQQGVKIGVKKEGMYRVTRTELQNAGFDVSSDSANWRLFTDGNEQAIIVGVGGQYIDFYGKGLDTRNTDTRTYFLIADAVPGKRMISKILNNIGGNVFSHNYRLTVEKKERTDYRGENHNGETENYFGRAVYSDLPICTNPDHPCISFDLTGVDPAGLNATITVKLQGIARTPATVEHDINVMVNGTAIGTVTGFGEANFSGDLAIPASALIEGSNIVQLTTALSSDTVLFDSIKVSYSRFYQADQNRVLFFTSGYRKVDVNGFTSPNVRVFDTTLDGNPQLISNIPVTQNGSTYSVRTPSNRPAVMYAVEDSGLLQVASIVPDNASTLGTPNNQADMIIISYSAPDFMAAAETWANYRRSTAGGGFTVKVVDVADIYDEFSYGAHSDTAVNEFLHYAYVNWQDPKPHYVLIIGDASTDARNYTAHGYNDLVPAKNVDLIYEESYSDEALADFTHDGVAEMAIGRIPARDAFSISTAFNKTMAFETPGMQSMNRGALFPFDLPLGFDFNAMSQAIAGQLPSSVPKTYVDRATATSHTDLIDALNTGKYVVNYSGHGSIGVWANANFFSSVDVPDLTNANSLSIITMLTCRNGQFMWDQNISVAEALLLSFNGGAAAAWASTTETTPDYQLTMALRFYQQLGIGQIKRIGDLVIDAKTTIAGSDVGYSWALLGDPALKVRNEIQ